MPDQPHYDLTAASRMLGELIDPDHQRKVRHERIYAELNTRCQQAGFTLEPGDIDWDADNEPEIDGMPADQWIDHMTEWN
jgi:hypothetical protein